MNERLEILLPQVFAPGREADSATGNPDREAQALRTQGFAEREAAEAVALIPSLSREMTLKCERLALMPESERWSGGMMTLVSGLTTLVQSAAAIRDFRGLFRGDRPRLDLIEDELFIALKQLVEARERSFPELARAVLIEDLPAILDAWAIEAPALLSPVPT
ncbi:MAG: hypothetical protein IT285_01225 [Bdellovibrionales bacterium]|nr:hypothetical protein [Bdellovibrionales bacterium]